jgi:hypothetical protein
MTPLLSEVARPVEAPGVAPEVDSGVIEEARRRQRRRRRGVALAVSAVAAVAAVGLAASGGPSSQPPPRQLEFGPSAPTVDARAFSGDGDLAFVSRGKLWVLDGSGALRRIAVPRGLVPASPAFSSDGRWLAYTGSTSGPGTFAIWRNTPELWIAHADGSDPHEVGWLHGPEVIGWSPRSDQLAVTEQGVVRTAYGYSVTRQTSAWLLSPDGSGRRIASAAEIDGGAWSPDGSRLALALDTSLVATTAPWSATVISYPVGGGKPTLWLALDSAAKVGRWNANLILPAGWWPGWGIGFWLDTASGNDPSVRDGGGLALWHVSAPGQSPQRIATTLSNGVLPPILASHTGALAIDNEPGNMGARPFWEGEQVERCSPASGRCTDVVHPRGSVSIDPQWSPDGYALAYSVGASQGGEGGAGFAQGAVAGWYDSLALWLYEPAGDRTIEVPAARGAVAPIWSAHGHSLLFVSHDGLWLWDGLRGSPREIAGPLLPTADWNAYFAQIDWSDQFAWSR